MSNRDKFREVYSRYLTDCWVAKPSDYVWTIDELPLVVDRMVTALAKGSGNKDSLAIRRTCRLLGIKYTYNAIEEYLK